MWRLWVIAGLLMGAYAPAAGADGGARGEGVVAGFGSIWTTGENGVVRIDAQTGRIVATVPTRPGDVIPALAAGEGSVWSLARRSLTRIDPDRDRTVGTPVRLPALSAAVAAGAGALWVVDYDAGILRELDPQDGHQLDEIPGVGLHAEAIAATPGAVWIASIGPWTADRHGFSPTGPGIVTRVDPRTDRIVARIEVGRGPGAIAVADGALWVTSFRGRRPEFSVTQIDTTGNRVVGVVRLHRLLGGVTTGAGHVWVVNPGTLVADGLDMSTGTLIRVDPRTRRVVTRRLPASSRPAAVTFSHGWLWVASPGNGTVLRLDPRTLRETRVLIPF
jgi:virginiamycin B lyase